MSNKKPFSLSDRLKSFTYAFAGIKTFFNTEHNSWIQLTAAVVVITLGLLTNLSTTEWCILIIVIGLVLMAEILNTSIERLTDMVSPQQNEMAKKVKDIAAAAVLVSAIIALIVGLLIFVPKI